MDNSGIVSYYSYRSFILGWDVCRGEETVMEYVAFAFLVFLLFAAILVFVGIFQSTQLPESHYDWMDKTDELLERAENGDEEASALLNSGKY